MGQTLLQLGRIAMMAFWFTFTLLALKMGVEAWATAPNRLTAAFFGIAAYAGFGMLLGMVIRFQHTQGVLRRGY